MIKPTLTLLTFLAITGVTLAQDPLLELVDNGLVTSNPTLRSYTLTVTGIGINNLSRFTVAGDVWQVQPDSEWLGDGSANALFDRDSYVIFGDIRLPNLGGGSWDYVTYPGGPPDYFTEETIHPPAVFDALGTLNNYFNDGSTEFYDSYLIGGAPSTTEVTHDLMHLVVPDGSNPGEINARITTWTDYTVDPISGGLTGGTVDVYDLFLPEARPLCGDTDLDGDIDHNDFVNFSRGWFGPDGPGHCNPEPPADWSTGDFDGDGDVDFDDFVCFSNGWFSPNGIGYDPSPPLTFSVPEPSALLILIVGSLCLLPIRTRN